MEGGVDGGVSDEGGGDGEALYCWGWGGVGGGEGEDVSVVDGGHGGRDGNETFYFVDKMLE